MTSWVELSSTAVLQPQTIHIWSSLIIFSVVSPKAFSIARIKHKSSIFFIFSKNQSGSLRTLLVQTKVALPSEYTTSSIFVAVRRFILLKERNMLLTMEEAYKQANENMPNPERLDKVATKCLLILHLTLMIVCHHPSVVVTNPETKLAHFSCPFFSGRPKLFSFLSKSSTTT